jgi:hypothetical protein
MLMLVVNQLVSPTYQLSKVLIWCRPFFERFATLDAPQPERRFPPVLPEQERTWGVSIQEAAARW